MGMVCFKKQSPTIYLEKNVLLEELFRSLGRKNVWGRGRLSWLLTVWEDSAHSGWHYSLGSGSWTQQKTRRNRNRQHGRIHFSQLVWGDPLQVPASTSLQPGTVAWKYKSNKPLASLLLLFRVFHPGNRNETKTLTVWYPRESLNCFVVTVDEWNTNETIIWQNKFLNTTLIYRSDMIKDNDTRMQIKYYAMEKSIHCHSW